MINGQNVNISKADLAALAAKAPSQLDPSEKAILEQAKKRGLV